MKIDFCPNKQRLISLSFPLQLNSVDSRSPSGLRQALHPRPHNRARFNSRSPSGLRQNRVACLFSFWCFNSRSPSGLRRLLQRYNKKEIHSKDKSRKSILVIILDEEAKAVKLELTDNQPLRNSNKIMFTWDSQPNIFV